MTKTLLTATMVFALLAITPPKALAQIITEIIDATGDGGGNTLSRPLRVAVDAVGNAYVTGFDSDNAFKITPTGAISEIIDATGDGGGNTLSRAEGVAVDAAGNVYVAGKFSENAFKIEPSGTVIQIIDATGDGGGNFLVAPTDLAVDAMGNVYVVAGQGKVFKIEPSGVITVFFDGGLLQSLHDIAVDASGNVFVTGFFDDNAFKIEPNGTVTQIIDATGDGAGNPLDTTNGLAVDGSGNVYLAGRLSDNAFKIEPSGTITQIIDSTATDGGFGPFDSPRDVEVDASGNVFVTAPGGRNGTFKIEPDGTISVIIDRMGGQLEAMEGLAVDNLGNVYVTGQISDNVFKIEFNGPAIGCRGYEPPLDEGPVTVKKNRVLPLRAQLVDADGILVTGADITALPVISIFFDDNIAPSPIDVTSDALSAGRGADGNQFTFDGSKWAFNLKTKDYSASGTYTMTMVSGDSAEYIVSPTCTALFVIE